MATYRDVWNAMNELEVVATKLTTVTALIDTALEALEKKDDDKAESLMYACSDFIKYYLKDYDENFKIAWNVTITAGRELDDAKAKLSRSENPENPQYTDEEMTAMCNQNV